jgi:hypothetical protein
VQRSTTIALGAAVVAAVGVLLLKAGPRPAPAPALSWSAALSASPPPVSPPLTPAPSVSAVSSPPVIPERKLPLNAPRQVRFGVVLIQYRGAQFAQEASSYKPEALQRALQLVELARKDFKAAVKQGDPGSTEDAGRIARKILEPQAEVELFSLAPGEVGGPIDTPRGYWIVRRIE